MKDFLKPWGGHHGLILEVFSWVAFISNPIAGLCVNTGFIFGYTFKEYNEAQWRGFKLLERDTWKDKFQWPDFITPLVLGAINLYFMKGSV